MDRSLEDVISDRQRRGNRGGNNWRQGRRPRDGALKVLPPHFSSRTALKAHSYGTTQFCGCRRVRHRSYIDAAFTNGKEGSTNIDTDWLHDKYEDDPESRQPVRRPRNRRPIDRYSPELDPTPTGAKLRVENLHYDLTEDDLEDLFTRIGPVLSVSIRFDRAGRSSGTAFVTYESIADARLSIREFDGANAHGQPIRLTLLPSAVDGARGRGEVRNPFDYAVKPGRSLFERVEEPRSGSGRDKRSRSPTGQRRSDTRKPPPEGVDRYVPGGRRSRSRSPPRRGQRGARDRGADSGRRAANGRARKTQDDLDKEMDDYFGTKGDSTGVAQANGAVTAVSAAVPGDGDVEMIE